MKNAQAKTINLLLYEGHLGGVISIEDSSWNSGVLYSAPRASVSELLQTDACQKYGVYLLLSNEKVYVGQSIDLAKRITQHTIGKDWWENVVILTTKDDNLGRSDIDYLEYVLIDKAFQINKLDCDNKRKGNPPKVDRFREVYLGQYLSEALFLMQLIGITVFSDAPVKSKGKKKSVVDKINVSEPFTSEQAESVSLNGLSGTVPPLPEKNIKIGEYVRTAMRNLSKNGFIFTEESIDEMCSSSWSIEHFKTEKPFMKRYIQGNTNNKDTEGKYVRFWAEIFTFGTAHVYISKEWYESDFIKFDNWYMTLR